MRRGGFGFCSLLSGLFEFFFKVLRFCKVIDVEAGLVVLYVVGGLVFIMFGSEELECVGGFF